tara:strand:+ start:325 stop:756 length:432 start_codon:yes stop_codon:yes gene_type:complete
MAYKGRYNPKNPSKYMGDPTKIVYRSLWERRFMKYCDENASVISWGSEEVVVPYISPIDGKRHRYFVDFIVKSYNKKGNLQTLLIEVKPKKQCVPPEKKSRVTRRYLREVQRWGVNKAKWDAATDYADLQGWQFVILTEDHLL